MTTEQNGSEPKIGKPLTALPDNVLLNRTGRYAAIWEQAAALKKNEWLPLTFPTKEQARSFRSSMVPALRNKHLRAIVRGEMVYISKEAT